MNNNQLNSDELINNQANNIQNNPSVMPNINMQGINATQQNVVPNSATVVSVPAQQNSVSNVQSTPQPVVPNSATAVSAPAQQNSVSNVQPTPQPVASTSTPTVSVPSQQSSMENVPTIEQNRASFVQNTQQSSTESQVSTKKGINYMLVIVLFVLILVSIFFLFPLLRKYI